VGVIEILHPGWMEVLYPFAAGDALSMKIYLRNGTRRNCVDNVRWLRETFTVLESRWLIADTFPGYQ